MRACTLLLSAALGALLAGCSAGDASADGEPVRCGQALCPSGSFCCDPGCSACSEGTTCLDFCGIHRCQGQMARAVGDCATSLGVYWDGSGCNELTGCECEGINCRDRYETMTDCRAHNLECVERTPAQ